MASLIHSPFFAGLFFTSPFWLILFGVGLRYLNHKSLVRKISSSLIFLGLSTGAVIIFIALSSSDALDTWNALFSSTLAVIFWIALFLTPPAFIYMSRENWAEGTGSDLFGMFFTFFFMFIAVGLLYFLITTGWTVLLNIRDIFFQVTAQ